MATLLDVVKSAKRHLTWSENWFSKLEPSLTTSTLRFYILACPGLVSIFNQRLLAAIFILRLTSFCSVSIFTNYHYSIYSVSHIDFLIHSKLQMSV